MTEATIEVGTVWERAAERFNLKPESIKKRWGPWVDMVPGAGDESICSDDEYLALLISYGNATASATGKARPKVSNAWVAANKDKFASRLNAAKPKVNDDVYDLVIDDIEADTNPGSLALTQDWRRETAIEAFEEAAAGLALQQVNLSNLNFYGHKELTEGEKDAIALQNAAQEIRQIAEIKQRTARAVAAALGAASPNAQ